jgi:glucokinase
MIVMVGDVGGTHSRIAYYDSDGSHLELLVEEIYPSVDYTGLDKILGEFAASHKEKSSHACLAIAGPVREGRIRTTNLPWTVDASQLALELGLETVTLINDLEAIAYSIDLLKPEDFAILNEGKTQAIGNAAIIAAGTGLGEAGLYWNGSQHLPFACEGGHTDFSPADELQDEMLRHLRGRFGHVSWERLVCGPGLLNIYNFLRDAGHGDEPDWLKLEMQQGEHASQITRHGMDGSSRLCSQALELFVSLYGSEAGNLALKIMATSGVYLGGGIAPKIVNELHSQAFLKAFCAKGRMSDLLKDIPIRVILDDKAGLLGAARCAVLKA